ncbi:hypothetical protein [Streptococcus merionis]|uniref:Uncharacterized protein n=1 Tax=Streptococcus merionis TaxID=400065 RepID=A0A239SSJ4_9STRE|nr:hypothetical protein [Streptococcus merionis]SNU88326.1 Uncharacterised protein [Streptococcus merionis]
MLANLLTVLGLGIAGIDPVGMMILVSFMTVGLSKSRAIIFGLGVFLGTTLLGIALSRVLGSTLVELSSIFDNLPDTAWVWIGVAIVIVFSYLAYRRLVTNKDEGEPENTKSNKGMYGAIAFMVFTAVTDPTFLAVLALSSRQQNIFWEFIFSAVWTLVSQAPLFILVGTILLNKHEFFINRFNTFYEKNKKNLGNVLTGIFILIAAVFSIDLVLFWLTGSWLIG